MKKCVITSTLIMCCMIAFGQTDKIVLVNTQKVGADRYRDIKGSPYFFDEWPAGKILAGSGEVFEMQEVNYNGFTNTFEVRDGDEYIELDSKWYLQVEFAKAENPDIEEFGEEEKIVFQKRGTADFSDSWMQILYKGKDYTLLKEFVVDKEKKVFNNVGQEVVVERFSKDPTYFVLAKGDMIRVKGKRKKTLQELGNASEAESHIKSNKLNLKTDAGMKALVVFYDTASE